MKAGEPDVAKADAAARAVLSLAVAICGSHDDGCATVVSAIVGALTTVIGAAEHPHEVLDRVLLVLDEARPKIAAMHAKIYAEVARRNASGLASVIPAGEPS